jgi:PadR family transcriptional regulator, regulatory protein AphA
VSEYFELPPQPAGEFDPVVVVTACIESGTDRLLLDDGALPPEFFDLSTGVAGTLVQRLTQYEIRMAAVVPDPSIHSQPFQDFAREANAGRSRFRFFPDREQAVAWLTAE